MLAGCPQMFPVLHILSKMVELKVRRCCGAQCVASIDVSDCWSLFGMHLSRPFYWTVSWACIVIKLKKQSVEKVINHIEC